MENLKRVCLVLPDRWAGSFALGIRRHFRSVSVVCVGDARTNETAASLGVAAEVTEELESALKGADLILMSAVDRLSGLDIERVVSACDNDATICAHGRSLAKVIGLIHRLNRSDVHYVSISARGSRELGSDIALATLLDLKKRTIALTPSKIDDLDALSNLQEYLQKMGVRVSAMSPKMHDRLLAESLHLPMIILLPMISCLVDSLGKNNSLTPESIRLLEFFTGFSSGNAATWAEELSRSKHYLLPALDAYRDELAAFREAYESGQVSERLLTAAQQMSILVEELESETVVSEPRQEPADAVQPESLPDIVNSLLTALGRLQSGSSGDNVTAKAARELAEQTQVIMERLTTSRPGASLSSIASAPILEAQPDNLGINEPSSHPVFSGGVVSQEYTFESIIQSSRAEAPPEDEIVPASFNILCRHDLHVLERTTRTLAAVRIELLNTEETWSDQGNRVIRVTIADGTQLDRARDLLKMSGVPLE